MNAIVKAQTRDGQGLNQGSGNRNEEDRGTFLELGFPMFFLQIPCLRLVRHT